MLGPDEACEARRGDTVYAVARVGEELRIEFLARGVAPAGPLVLIAGAWAAGRQGRKRPEAARTI